MITLAVKGSDEVITRLQVDASSLIVGKFEAVLSGFRIRFSYQDMQRRTTFNPIFSSYFS